MTGRLVSVFERRAISFILRDDKNEEIFAHLSDYPDHKFLPRGSRVTFEIGEYGGRRKAIKIQPFEAV